jgi:hypothetical protein
MSYRRLYLFVEGNSDESFISKVLEPSLRQHYDYVDYFQYSNRPKILVDNFLRSLAGREGAADYLFIGDLDRPERCITAAKERLRKTYPRLDPGRIRLVCLEIESWYAAGVRRDHPRYGMLSFTQLSETDGINKETFEAALVAKGNSPYEARLAILESFDLELARERNRSLRYFVDKAAKA